MARSTGSEDLARRIQDLAVPREAIDPQDIMDVVESVMATVEGDLSTVNLKLYAEIESLARFINAAKAEIASLRPDEITDEHVPAATDELTAVVGATEQATNSIFEAVEHIETLTGMMEEEVAASVTESITAIYEACGFQDITGQRITKVVSALQHIDQKVEALLEAFGSEIAREPRSEGKKPRPASNDRLARPDEHLINGPQLPEAAASQDDIDALLASFD